MKELYELKGGCTILRIAAVGFPVHTTPPPLKNIATGPPCRPLPNRQRDASPRPTEASQSLLQCFVQEVLTESDAGCSD